MQPSLVPPPNCGTPPKRQTEQLECSKKKTLPTMQHNDKVARLIQILREQNEQRNNESKLRQVAPWLRVEGRGLVVDVDMLPADMETMIVETGSATLTACAQGVCIKGEHGMLWHWRDGLVETFSNQPYKLHISEDVKVLGCVVDQLSHGFEKTWTFEGGGTLTATVDALDQICAVETHNLNTHTKPDGTMVVLGTFR
jgi:hypothetical protein